MIPGPLRQIRCNVVDERSCEMLLRRMAQRAGEGLEYRQVRRCFKIQDPAGLLGLIVLVETKIAQRFENLRSTVIDPMRPAHKGNDGVAVRGLV